MQKNIRFFESGLALVEGRGNLMGALATLVQLSAEAAHSNSASFYIADWQENVLKPLITCGLPPEYVEACGHVPIGDQCCGRAVQHRKPWIVSDMLNDPLFASAKQAAQLSPIRSAFSVPVITLSGECLGSLACHYADIHVPTPEEIKRNETWAEMMAHAIVEYKNAPAESCQQGAAD